MRRFEREEAIKVARKALDDYFHDTQPAATDWDDVVETIVSAIHTDFVMPAIDFWKRRLGSEIQDLQLRESLLSCHLRLYIANFGTPPLEELVSGAKEKAQKRDMA